MADSKEILNELAQEGYEHGFSSDIETETIAAGLDEGVVRLISEKKGEPQWMLDFRLKAFNQLQKMSQPR